VADVTTAPSLSVWETGSGSDDAYVDTIPNLKGTVAAIENPGTPAAEEQQLGASLCGEVIDADQQPPPVDGSTWSAAMTEFAAASKILHTGADGYPAGGQAQSDLASGMTKLSAFLAAIGK
jgi:hypothetical protein